MYTKGPFTLNHAKIGLGSFFLHTLSNECKRASLGQEWDNFGLPPMVN